MLRTCLILLTALWLPLAQAAETLSEGTVKKLKADAITLQHGPIANLGMPAMTMTFKADASLLKGVKVGDPVRFAVEQRGEDLVIKQLQIAR